MFKLDACYSCRSCGENVPCYLIKAGPHIVPSRCSSDATMKVEWRRLDSRKVKKPSPDKTMFELLRDLKEHIEKTPGFSPFRNSDLHERINSVVAQLKKKEV